MSSVVFVHVSLCVKVRVRIFLCACMRVCVPLERSECITLLTYTKLRTEKPTYSSLKQRQKKFLKKKELEINSSVFLFRQFEYHGHSTRTY